MDALGSFQAGNVCWNNFTNKIDRDMINMFSGFIKHCGLTIDHLGLGHIGQED